MQFQHYSNNTTIALYAPPLCAIIGKTCVPPETARPVNRPNRREMRLKKGR